MLKKQDVMISIHTVRQGISVPLFQSDGEDDSEEEYGVEEMDALQLRESGNEEDDGPEEAEMLMEGRMVSTTHRAELVYEESELTGMEGSTTKIGFDRACPELISMLRSGSVSTALIFEPRQRHICIYNTPFSTLEVCVQTLEVKNELLEKGELYLDYLIEIHGAKTERCKMHLKANIAE